MRHEQPPLWAEGWEAEADAKNGHRLTADEQAFLDLHGPAPADPPSRPIEDVPTGGLL